MRTLMLPCSCGEQSCTTQLILTQDNEKPNNILLKIIDEKHDVLIFASLDSEDVHNLVSVLRTKYKGL